MQTQLSQPGIAVSSSSKFSSFNLLMLNKYIENNCENRSNVLNTYVTIYGIVGVWMGVHISCDILRIIKYISIVVI